MERLARHRRDVTRVDFFGHGIDEERGAHEAVGGTDRARHEGHPANPLPVGIERQLLVEDRRVGHDAVLLAVVDGQLTVDIFKDGRIPGRIRNGQVQRRSPPVGGFANPDAERLLPQGGDRLRHRAEIIEHILGPHRNGEDGLAFGGAILRLREVKQSGCHALFIHAIRRGDLVAGGDDRTVFGGPSERVFLARGGPLDAAGERVEIGMHVIIPVHAPSRYDSILIIGKNNSGAHSATFLTRGAAKRNQRFVGGDPDATVDVAAPSSAPNRNKAHDIRRSALAAE